MKRGLGVVIFLLCSLAMQAQDLTGTWIGSGGSGAPHLELVIMKCGNKYYGYTFDQVERSWCKANFEGVFDPATRTLKGRGVSFIANRYDHVLTSYNLKFEQRNGGAVLKSGGFSGFSDMSPLELLEMLDGSSERGVFLRRVSKKVQKTAFMEAMCNKKPPATKPPVVKTPPPKPPVAKPPVPAKPNVEKKTEDKEPDVVTPPPPPPPIVKKAEPVTQEKQPASPPAKVAVDENLIKARDVRKTSVVQTILTSETKIRIRVYDNGIEDGDSISIMHNDRVITSHRRITIAYYEFEIMLDPADIDHDITLIAHNLGSIPPNTATVEIVAGAKKYTLTASTDLNKNAVVRLRHVSE